jgi:CubicO group peptidase (beta-lactamase class C family)
MRTTTGAILLYLTSLAPLASAQSRLPPGLTKAQVAANPSSDVIDDVIRGEMLKRHIAGLSLAIIEGGKIVKARGYGVVEKGGDDRVTESTLFQAGSISKPVAALGALLLVEKGKLDLDEDVNARLISWKVPENEFTRGKKVTLRGLLSHTAGLTVHGFPGYSTDGQVPTLVQVLDGEKPTNTAPIRVDILPGSRWRYSGGGYTVMQQLMIDVTGKPFPQIMQQAVLGPLGMQESTFEQPLPAPKARLTATGSYQDRSLVQGRWHLYPEMAAAGLWTTPSDLARFAIGVQEALAGRSDKTLSGPMARQMLTEQKNTYGLGLGLQGGGGTSRFGHGGRDEGFDAQLVAYAETGQGAAIMINANDNSRMVSRILEAIAREYRWPGYPTFTPPDRRPFEVAGETLVACTGRYEFANNQMLTFATGRGRLLTLVDGFPDEEFLPEADDRFSSTQRDVQVTFLKGGEGEVSGLLWRDGGRERKVPRIGPLFHQLRAQSDPDLARTEKVATALKALGEGGRAIAESPLLTPGARADFGGGGTTRDLAGTRPLIFLGERDVAGRLIERHQGEVNRILFYRLVTDKGERGLLVHLTADGLITDYDIVED